VVHTSLPLFTPSALVLRVIVCGVVPVVCCVVVVLLVLRVVVCGVVLVVSCVVLLWCCSCRVCRVVLVVCLCVWPVSLLPPSARTASSRLATWDSLVAAPVAVPQECENSYSTRRVHTSLFLFTPSARTASSRLAGIRESLPIQHVEFTPPFPCSHPQLGRRLQDWPEYVNPSLFNT